MPNRAAVAPPDISIEDAMLKTRPMGVDLAIALLALATALGAPTAASAQGHATPPTARQLAPIGLERMWAGQATLDYQRDKVRHLVADEEIVVAQATSGLTTCFSAETGKKLWAVQLGRLDAPSYPVIMNDEYVLAITGMTLYGVDKRSGDIVWQVNLPTHPSTSPAADDAHVYVGSLDGSLYAFDLRKIKQLYNENLLPQWSNETLVWRYKTAKEITSPPISDGVRVSFASLDRSLYTVTADRRKLVFQFETDAPIAAALASMEHWLYLASQDQNFYCINAQNGQVRWSYISGSPIRRNPHVVNHRVYLAPDRGGMFCLNADNGRKIWWRPKTTEFIGVSKSFVFATDDTDNLVVIDHRGIPRGSLPLRAFPKRVRNVRSDRIIVAAESGLIVALRERGREFPDYHLYPEKRPIVPLLAPEEPSAGQAPTEDAPKEAAPNEAAPKEGATEEAAPNAAAPKTDDNN